MSRGGHRRRAGGGPPPARSRAPEAAATSAGGGQLRLIAGRWRGRKLPVAAVPGLRPTPNRLRETLFNWLAFEIDGARCLDLYAGTGALGLEALSRGAAHCDFVEPDRRARAMLEQSLQTLQATDQAGVHAGPALSLLAASGPPAQPGRSYDLVFVDPPFADEAWADVLAALPPRLAPGARVYLERPARYSAPWSQDWTVLRESRAGESMGALLTHTPGESSR